MCAHISVYGYVYLAVPLNICGFKQTLGDISKPLYMYVYLCLCIYVTT